jgi:transcriptional regulator with XRE-family HTH domain
MQLKKNFGARLKELRKARKLSQEQLAELVNVDAKHISFLETGRNFPSADLLERLVKIFNIEFKDMFNFTCNLEKNEIINNINLRLVNMDVKKLIFLYKIILELGE